MLRRALILTIIAGALAIFSFAQAQESGDRRGGPGNAPQGEQGGRGGWDATMRERWTGAIKEQLGGSEDEWKAIQSKVEKIIIIQRDMRTSYMGFGRGRGGGGGDTLDQPQSKVAEALNNLRASVGDRNTPAEDLTRRLKAFREAREKAKVELNAIQKELKAQVNPRQEAVLVINGIIE